MLAAEKITQYLSCMTVPYVPHIFAMAWRGGDAIIRKSYLRGVCGGNA